MESSALNVAHQQHRRAEANLRYKRFDEAIVCHKNAASLLEDAMKLTKVPKALESLRLQHDYHVRQQDIVRLKRDEFETFKRALENNKKMSFKFVKDENLSSLQQEDGKNNLQLAIYKTMEEADSLLELLVRHEDGNDANEKEATFPKPVAPVVEGSKRPKDERTVIEELHTLNHQLRALVVQLVTQLDASTREAERLRSVVRRLEAAAANRENAMLGAGVVSEAAGAPDHNHTVSAESAGGGGSPFVFSPCGDIEADVNASPHELPALAPLEMPDFDFSVFSKRACSDSTL